MMYCAHGGPGVRGVGEVCVLKARVGQSMFPLAWVQGLRILLNPLLDP